MFAGYFAHVSDPDQGFENNDTPFQWTGDPDAMLDSEDDWSNQDSTISRGKSASDYSPQDDRKNPSDPVFSADYLEEMAHKLRKALPLKDKKLGQTKYKRWACMQTGLLLQ